MTTQHSASASQIVGGDRIQDPSEAHHLFAEACNAGDLNRLLGYFDPDAVIVERNGELTSGVEAIRSHLQRLLSMRPKMEILASRAVENGDLAQLSSSWECAATAPDGSAVQLSFRGSELCRRQSDGSWRILIDNPWGAG